MIGRRIKRMRQMRKMTQKELGIAVGFKPESAEIRISQYESEARTPKAELARSMASTLGVSSQIIGKYDIATPDGLLCTLFELEELYGLSLFEREGRVYFGFTNQTGADAVIKKWHRKKKALFCGMITRDTYNDWKYSDSFHELINPASIESSCFRRNDITSYQPTGGSNLK